MKGGREWEAMKGGKVWEGRKGGIGNGRDDRTILVTHMYLHY